MGELRQVAAIIWRVLLGFLMAVGMLVLICSTLATPAPGLGFGLAVMFCAILHHMEQILRELKKTGQRHGQ